MSATDSAPRLEKLQQQVEELCGATVRAAAPAADFTFRGRKPERSGRFLKIRAPHLRPDLAKDDYQSFRGAADGLALRIRYSDEELHQKLMPEGDIGQVVFEILEQLRVESLVPAHMAGTKDNLIHRFTRWCRAYSASNMIENHIGLLVYTIAQSAWSRITGLPVDETTEDLIEPNRMMLAPHIGGFLRNLSKHGHDQELFAQSALGIVEVIEEMVEMMTRDPDDPKQENKSKAAEQAKSFSLLFFPDEGEESLFDTPSAGSPARNMREISQQLAQYQVFSKEHDRITPIEKLVRTALIDDYRTQLDKRVAGQGVNLPRLTRQLSQILSTPVRDGWQFGEEDGYLDGARLTRLLTSPNYRQLFKQERYKPQTDAAVTLLIDNTGSMKQYIESVATLVEIFAKALDGAGASSEILGYSTRSWKAGPLYKKWQRSGSPDNPGRLCELQHIIYKDADTPWRRARRNLAGMLKADIHKEGVEGEALLWASERLLAREESRKILIVLCDGCPMETATNLHNPEHYLDNHLKQVAQMLEIHPDIELYALGFGLDLSPYYSANLALDLPDILENRVFNEIVTLLARGQRRR